MSSAQASAERPPEAQYRMAWPIIQRWQVEAPVGSA